MPESPEVQALTEELAERLTGHALAAVDVVEFRALKTRARTPDTLVGQRLTGTARHGKHVDLVFGAAHLVVSLGRHGWARWGAADVADPTEPPDMPVDAPPTLVVLEFDDGSTLELTDAGDWVSLGCFVVDDPAEVPAVAKLGPDPADPDFSRTEFDAAVSGRRKQVKAVLQDQESLAGIGNAYSDEILFTAKLSPVGHAAALTAEESDRLFAATVGTISDAIAAQRGVPIAELKAAKVASMRVHGRAGESCPVCGDTIRDFSFASTTAQYCPTDQTHGELLPLK
jgi:formamidopyrimidine-DNA glycosylase